MPLLLNALSGIYLLLCDTYCYHCVHWLFEKTRKMYIQIPCFVQKHFKLSRKILVPKCTYLHGQSHDHIVTLVDNNNLTKTGKFLIVITVLCKQIKIK